MICPFLNIGRADTSTQCQKENCALWVKAIDGEEGACSYLATAQVGIDFIQMMATTPVMGGPKIETIGRK